MVDSRWRHRWPQPKAAAILTKKGGTAQSDTTLEPIARPYLRWIPCYPSRCFRVATTVLQRALTQNAVLQFRLFYASKFVTKVLGQNQEVFKAAAQRTTDESVFKMRSRTRHTIHVWYFEVLETVGESHP